MLAIKLGFGLAILLIGAGAGALPLLRRAAARESLFLSRGNAFAAGVFLGTGFVHMLPESSRAWSALGFEYPIAFLLAAAGCILLLLFEHVLVPEGAHELVHAPSSERFSHLHEGERRAFTVYAVLTALSVHALLAGLALGARPDLAGALVIFVAIIAHKSTEGFALGVSLARDRMPPRQAWTLLALFSLATPLGIGVGAGLGELLAGPARTGIEAAFLALAAGTFVYVATLDILRDEFLEPGGRLAKWLFVVAGTAATALIALWL